MNLLQLKYFNTVATLENMSKASEYLHVSQSALSKNISKLETEIGYPLFDRNGKTIILNESGVRFLSASEQFTEALEEAVKDIQLMNSGRRDVVRIGIVDFCADLSGVLTSFLSLHPDTRYDISSIKYGRALPNMNEYDVILCPDEPRYSVIRGTKIYEEKYYLAVNTLHPLAGKAVITGRNLPGLDLVFQKEDVPEQSYTVLQALSIKPEKVFFVNSPELHLQMVEAGLACGFVPESAASLYRGAEHICLIPITDQRFSRSVKIAFRRKKHLEPQAEELKRYLIRHYRIENVIENTEQ